MENFIPVNIVVWQQIIDQYKSSVASQRLVDNDLGNLQELLIYDINNIARNKTNDYQIIGGNLIYFRPGFTQSVRTAYLPSNWEGYPTWALCLPILNYENIEVSFYEGSYTKTIVTNDLATFIVPEWNGIPEVKSTLISGPMLINMDVPFSFKNQSDNPAIILNLRFIPSLLAE